MTETQNFANVLVELTHLVDRVFADGCRECDLTPQQCKLLYLLDNGPVAMGPLSEMLMLERSSLTGLVDRGVRRGLVRRVDGVHDRRVRTVELTADGEYIVRKVRREVTERLDTLTAILRPRERNHLSGLIEHIVAAPRDPTIAA